MDLAMTAKPAYKKEISVEYRRNCYDAEAPEKNKLKKI